MNELVTAMEMLQQSVIMIADDEPANAAMLERLLNINGYERVNTTIDPESIVPMFQKLKPDLLLLDLAMPYISGFDVLQQLNDSKNNDYLPVIVVSALDERANRLRALDLGARDFIAKPFDPSEVLVRIRNMLELRKLHNEVNDYNRLLEQKVRERTQALRGAETELVDRMLQAAEFRDDETGKHIERIGVCTARLAQLADMPSKFCDLIGHASKMHDIGKIAIPDSILLKPRSLTESEREIMKTHTTKGAQLLSGSKIEIFQMGERIALGHHEKWNGTGYPQRLGATDIPIESRMTAIMDVFDALLSVRPYKKAWPLEQVLLYIRNSRGMHFDPALVDLFLDHVDNFIELRDKIGI